MKILIYKNSFNNEDESLIKSIHLISKKYNFSSEVITEKDLIKSFNAQAIVILGGDGTILRVVDFVIKNNLLVIGVNFGTMGFLTEFEKGDLEIALSLLRNKDYIIDEREVLTVICKNKSYFALNDVVLQRKYLDNYKNLVIKIEVKIDDNFVDIIKGDGVIVSTPTGSTAYSLSAGGAILSPNIKANILTPICAHSLKSKPIIFSSDSFCSLKIVDGIAGLYLDGRFIDNIDKDSIVKVTKSEHKVLFVRKKDSNFYKVLLSKFSLE